MKNMMQWTAVASVLWMGSVMAATDNMPAGPVVPGRAMNIDLGGGVTLEMVWIDPGEFEMGSPEKEKGRGNNETQHHVMITKGFWMGKYEVTQAQWEQVMGDNPGPYLTKDPSYLKKAGKDAPVEGVSWNDCQEFIKKLNAQVENQKSRIGNGQFRFPTEAEWEYACRAGTKTPLYSGAADRHLDAVAWYADNSGETTHPVGQKKPNAWGLYDMHGNVWEWCQDWCGVGDDYAAGAAKDPTGAAFSPGSYHVARGGGWGSNAGYCRSANRGSLDPNDRGYYVGFRLVRSLP
jgi:formylglycine-generating enzyme required for sulfatase activity